LNFNWLRFIWCTDGTARNGSRFMTAKHLGECVMSHKRRKSVPSQQPGTDDLKDWAIIGSIIVSSSLLVWGPLFIG
jgi:hypothetical protein